MTTQSIVQEALVTGQLTPDQERYINRQLIACRVSPDDMVALEQLFDALSSHKIHRAPERMV